MKKIENKPSQGDQETEDIVEQTALEDKIDSKANQPAVQEQITINAKEQITQDEPEEDPDELVNLRVAMLGNVDSGKSTLSGVLTSAPGSKDDGRGLMRQKVFNFAHELNNGRTSSVAHEIMGFKENGEQYVTKIAHT